MKLFKAMFAPKFPNGGDASRPMLGLHSPNYSRTTFRDLKIDLIAGFLGALQMPRFLGFRVPPGRGVSLFEAGLAILEAMVYALGTAVLVATLLSWAWYRLDPDAD